MGISSMTEFQASAAPADMTEVTGACLMQMSAARDWVRGLEGAASRILARVGQRVLERWERQTALLLAQFMGARSSYPWSADPGEVAELVLMSVAVSVSGASAEGVGEAQS